MYSSKTVLQIQQKSKFPKFNRFFLEDQELIQDYIDTFNPASCEYNFANLFAWQDDDKLFWTLYQERLLIYDETSKCSLMPLGEDFLPEELVILSLNLKNAGLSPDFNLASSKYLEKNPGIEKYYTIKEERDHSEYIYKTESLSDLTGKKLHKKRNLISQFKRSCPEVEVHLLKKDHKDAVLEFSRKLLDKHKILSKTLKEEMNAIEISLEYFEQLSLEGLVLTMGERVIAFSVFSRLNHSTYDIQFEKADPEYKGAAQVINQETAIYLKDKCLYLNREQDLGIKGLRQAKMSYEPIELITPYNLTFAPLN
jgi:hypothetical protein